MFLIVIMLILRKKKKSQCLVWRLERLKYGARDSPCSGGSKAARGSFSPMSLWYSDTMLLTLYEDGINESRAIYTYMYNEWMCIYTHLYIMIEWMCTYIGTCTYTQLFAPRSLMPSSYKLEAFVSLCVYVSPYTFSNQTDDFTKISFFHETSSLKLRSALRASVA